MSEPNGELYKNERYKFDSKELEEEEFRGHERRVQEAQKRLEEKHKLGRPRRVFHTKTHACLKGKLNLLEDRPESTRHGIFASGGKTSYNVLARFSNGVGFEEHDLKPDVRGIALKIFGVDDSSADAVGQGPRTLDFLMTNSPTGFGQDQEEFVEFMEANVNPGALGLNLGRFLFEHDEVAKLLLKATLKIVPSVTSEQYWSGHAYLLGPDRAMKFNVRPSDDAATEVKDEDLRREMSEFDSRLGSVGEGVRQKIEHLIRTLTEDASAAVNPNYLRADLLERVRRGPVKFIFSVQLEKDTESTPIEKGLVEWKESDSPSIPVAELVLDQQDRSLDSENLRFSPGHRIPAHRPLGNLGRGRVFAYEASQSGRHAAQAEPDESMFFGG
jgi:catalase